jgi:hypothetical protein
VRSAEVARLCLAWMAAELQIVACPCQLTKPSKQWLSGIQATNHHQTV